MISKYVLNAIVQVLVMVASASPADAKAGAPSKAATELTCKALMEINFSTIPDAPTQLTDAQVVSAYDSKPAYCRVQGYVSPQVGLEIRLPVSDWNGKFLEVGCGGFCGGTNDFIVLCDNPLQKGYACLITDMGHKSTMLDGKWAYNNLQAQIDYGFRSTHVAALGGKAITEHYFGTAPVNSYYLGCSCGGRQGLVEAQQFPWDFDGIIVGAPPINFAEVFMDMLWKSRAVTGSEGQPLFSPADITRVHQAVLAKCDMNDGVTDGLIGDPRKCKFDPSELICKTGAQAGCLSRPQVDALKKVYAGPMTSKGELIFRGGMTPGSETSASGIADYQIDRSVAFSRNFFQYMGFMPAPGPGWKSRDFDFDHDYKRLGMLDSLYPSTNPDLRKFKEAGGKLILWQGWDDGAIPPVNTIDYYETVERTMGGRQATRDFFRLFMVPGMDHCWLGEGAWMIDYLNYLETWVEKGRAPDVMIGVHPEATSKPLINFPIDRANIGFTRPIYPYPAQAVYKGTGNPNDAENFEPADR
jgi:hypothetical protein